MFEDLQKYIPNETVVSARDMNTLGEVVRTVRNISGVRFFADSQGVYFRPNPPSQPPENMGEFQYQNHTMVAQNKAGWDVQRLGPFPAT